MPHSQPLLFTLCCPLAGGERPGQVHPRARDAAAPGDGAVQPQARQHEGRAEPSHGAGGDKRRRGNGECSTLCMNPGSVAPIALSFLTDQC